jgi:signal transduction histidine kinase
VAIGSAQAAFNWLGKQPPKLEEVQQSLSRVVEAGAQATEFIERIRNLIKKRDPQKAPFDINNAILDVVDLTRREMANNKVSVQTQFAGDLPFIQGDPGCDVSVYVASWTEWARLLKRLYLPPFPMHAWQLIGLYMGQLAPSEN